jgi:hypothetical protein
MTIMGKGAALLMVVIAGLLLLLGSGTGTVAADTPVAVLPGGDIVLTLPVSPSVDRITSDLARELRQLAASATDTRLSEALARMAANPELLRQVATSPADMFDTGEAIATATAIYDSDLDPAVVTVVIANVELVPGYRSTAVSKDHEDGHALINRTMAIRCSSAGLATLVDAGHQGERLINGLVSYLSAASTPVHEEYHNLVGGAVYGQHMARAQEALAEATACG